MAFLPFAVGLGLMLINMIDSDDEEAGKSLTSFYFQNIFSLNIPLFISYLERAEQISREVRRMREKVGKQIAHNQQMARRVSIESEMNTFQKLSQYHLKRKEALSHLAINTKMKKRIGKNIGIFGLTSTGKSTIINSLLGRRAAVTGVGETTTEMTPHHGKGFTLWDAPGRNDEMSYTSEKFLSSIKELTQRLIVIQSTVKENVDLMRLLDRMGLSYYILVNKLDLVDEDEQKQFQQNIQSEIRSIDLRCIQHVFFLSGKHPQMFPDWVQLVNKLT